MISQIVDSVIYDFQFTIYDLEKHTNYNYDILDRMTISEVDPNTLDITTSYNYDAIGNRTSIVDPIDL